MCEGALSESSGRELRIAVSHKSSQADPFGIDEVILFPRSSLPSSGLMPKDIPVPKWEEERATGCESDPESAAAVRRVGRESGGIINRHLLIRDK